ncbi:MAG TPA: RNA polymerase sigma factor SigJ [Actinospica sp.]|jgi:RNA polymerase sigma-70 factor (ECF subfamily)|nr:RNA polymerase sigma factor SigJ [Actinospica sp.]
MAVLEDFEEHRRYLGAVGYRMLGSLSDAEDVVQDAWLRWRDVDHTGVENPRGYLTTVVTRLCYTRLGSARAQREAYYGEWLPEPLLDESPTPEDRAELGEDVSYAVMALLERLSPAERAAFVLHDVFGVDFGLIGTALDRSDAAVRQLASRARKQIKDESPRRTVDPAQHRRAVEAFIAAAFQGDIMGLMKVLDPETVWHSDGGGIVRAGVRPIQGGDNVSRLVLGLIEHFVEPGTTSSFVRLDGEAGIAVHGPDGAPIAVFGFCVDDGGLITATHVVVNPAKLTRVPAAGV